MLKIKIPLMECNSQSHLIGIETQILVPELFTKGAKEIFNAGKLEEHDLNLPKKEFDLYPFGRLRVEKLRDFT